MKFIVETSARHAHVTTETLEKLFGKGHVLTKKKELSQPGQIACEEKITIVGPKGTLNVTILGPVRKADQIEISFTDARAIGLKNVPVRESGDLENTPGIKIKGPLGEFDMPKGVLVAKRHIHMLPAEAEALGVKDKEIVSVKINSEGRSTIFGDTVVRVSPEFSLSMHIDTDESNAACAFGTCYGEIVK